MKLQTTFFIQNLLDLSQDGIDRANVPDNHLEPNDVYAIIGSVVSCSAGFSIGQRKEVGNRAIIIALVKANRTFWHKESEGYKLIVLVVCLVHIIAKH
jgi:hypothetical protein